ncbi:hypothetical protein JAAARDRAFT_585513 [Jaapia argillacea MUCL 33604]|uniref:Uncharacterized protein n=1 Tax=Jaapia argillacea MUCL 33604 TaxID=933084 RepID=A0A067P6G3_9AGAM|nr:hypothetical protein JAAARDRAFT_585513 [Jaapia argillacea MUCL 33604]
MGRKPHHGLVSEAHDAVVALRVDMPSFYKPLRLVAEHMNVVLGIFENISEIHGVLQAACKLLTAAYKVLEAQRQRDAHVVELSKAMLHLFTWSTAVNSLKDQLHCLKDTVKRMADHSLLCAQFIRKYVSQGFVRHMIWSPDSKLAELIDGCKELRETFLVDLGVANLAGVDELKCHQKMMMKTPMTLITTIPTIGSHPIGFDYPLDSQSSLTNVTNERGVGHLLGSETIS